MDIRVGVKVEGRETVLKILGMHCATCSLTVQRALLSVRGVRWAEASLASNEARLVASPELDYGELLKAVRRVGYDVYREAVYISVPGARPEDAAAVERAARLWGVFRASFSPATSLLYVEYNPLEVGPRDVAEALARAGFKAGEVSRSEVDVDVDRKAAERDARDLASRLLPAVPITAVLMASMMFPAVPPLAQLLMASAVQFYSGWRFLSGAYRAFRNGTANMDTLVALGTLSTFTYSAYAALTGGRAFFEASAAVITFVLAGRYMESRMKLKTGDAVRRLAQMAPPRARVKTGEGFTEVDSAQVEPGQLVEVREGERIPVDGYVEEGMGYADESAFTGEPMPAEKKPGDLALAGTLLVRGRLLVRATRSGAHTYLAEVVRLVRQAQNARLPIQRLADRVAGVFTWAVMAAAAATFAAWALRGAPPGQALLFAASVLVVACPCALGLATPLAVVVGVGRAAEKGLLVKNPEAFEKALRARFAVFDKTGTLTKGSPRVVKYVGDVEALAYAASAESQSTHPLARALVDYASELGLAVQPPESYDSFPGMGVYATVGGRSVGVGNERLMEALGAEVPQGMRELAEGLRSEGLSAVYVAVDGKVRGLAALGDKLRPDAASAVQRLRSMGLEPVVASGDNERAVAAVAAKLGISRYFGGAEPERKAEIVRRLREEGGVIFVGDGVNDAPALAAADVGIAVSNGTEVAKEAGDVVVARGDLSKVAEFLQISRRVEANARFNLIWAFAYNIALIPIAAGLFYPALSLRPELAGLAMSLSSITVTLNALRLKRA
ncbi:copper-translocating P-type ATPase [Thermoproteus sp. CP80]|uniref:heavy metal translocating P-type ATPase n=1 Tax=Thermoproteus sp. CP80 TaxID=1650659 RepID=UPI0009BD52F8|nr:heavy metal translocating P-type ATPase [Thermoproteus sp. CP80]PLC64963.1 copper-translocating P-type ATPase [Thermoproteus sp. CP80]